MRYPGAGGLKAIWPLMVGLVIVMAAGCAQRADWIEGTLVTVDVTGRWAGKWGAPGGDFDVTLRQIGPKVTGDLRLTGRNAMFWNGPIEGVLTGDVFKFGRPDGRLRGEVIVAGEGMSGTVFFDSATRPLRLQRQP